MDEPDIEIIKREYTGKFVVAILDGASVYIRQDAINANPIAEIEYFFVTRDKKVPEVRRERDLRKDFTLSN